MAESYNWIYQAIDFDKNNFNVFIKKVNFYIIKVNNYIVIIINKYNILMKKFVINEIKLINQIFYFINYLFYVQKASESKFKGNVNIKKFQFLKI